MASNIYFTNDVFWNFWSDNVLIEMLCRARLELRIRHKEAMAFISDIENVDDDGQIIKKFEPINVRNDFEYAFKMFSKALDSVLPRKEADPYIDDFKFLSQKDRC
jgi:hypothetical protein